MLPVITTYNNDKMQHFILNMLPAAFGYAVALYMPSLYEFRRLAGMSSAGVAAYAKEQFDKRDPKKHTSDGLDFVAGMCGAACLISILP